jgi:hypothetical protein
MESKCISAPRSVNPYAVQCTRRNGTGRTTAESSRPVLSIHLPAQSPACRGYIAGGHQISDAALTMYARPGHPAAYDTARNKKKTRIDTGRLDSAPAGRAYTPDRTRCDVKPLHLHRWSWSRGWWTQEGRILCAAGSAGARPPAVILVGYEFSIRTTRNEDRSRSRPSGRSTRGKRLIIGHPPVAVMHRHVTLSDGGDPAARAGGRPPSGALRRPVPVPAVCNKRTYCSVIRRSGHPANPGAVSSLARSHGRAVTMTTELKKGKTKKKAERTSTWTIRLAIRPHTSTPTV